MSRPTNIIHPIDLDGLIYDTIGGVKVGVSAPDEYDAVLCYCDTREEAREVLTKWFTERGFTVCTEEELRDIENTLREEGGGGDGFSLSRHSQNITK